MTDTQDTPLRLQREGAIATLTFHRPAALNAIDVPMALALRDAVRALAQDRALRCVVLEGAGRAFMAGGDLDTLAADPVRGAAELLAPLNEAVVLLGQLDAPVIAKVHGAAAGAGLSLMLQADFVCAAEGTRFNLAYINLGASCDVGASWALPRIVGLRNALEIAMLGETLDCAQAQRLSLINRVLPPAELDAAVQQPSAWPPAPRWRWAICAASCARAWTAACATSWRPRPAPSMPVRARPTCRAALRRSTPSRRRNSKAGKGL